MPDEVIAKYGKECEEIAHALSLKCAELKRANEEIADLESTVVMQRKYIRELELRKTSTESRNYTGGRL